MKKECTFVLCHISNSLVNSCCTDHIISALHDHYWLCTGGIKKLKSFLVNVQFVFEHITGPHNTHTNVCLINKWTFTSVFTTPRVESKTAVKVIKCSRTSLGSIKTVVLQPMNIPCSVLTKKYIFVHDMCGIHAMPAGFFPPWNSSIHRWQLQLPERTLNTLLYGRNQCS